MKVPLLDLKAQLDYLGNDLIAAVTRVVKSTQYIQGPEVEGLEKEIAEYSGAAHGVGVTSGTDALLVCLMGLGIGAGDKVLTSPYSFFATMGVILRLGAVPVFADIDPVSFNIDPSKVGEILADDKDRKIKAIIPVHLYGQCADMGAILNLARQYDLPVIEDAAQAIGAEYPMLKNGEIEFKKAGSMGTAGCFSFFPSKNLGGIGDGGMVVTQEKAFAEKLVLLRNHGAHPKYFHKLVGGNFRLDPIQAAALRVKLPYLERWHRRRAENAELYKRLFTESGLTAEGKIQLPTSVFAEKAGGGKPGKNVHIYNQYILRVEKRDALRQWLSANDIGCEIYYPVPLHKQECLGKLGNQACCPEAEKAAEETLALPIYPELTSDMQRYVVEKIMQFYR
ncbi:MAG: DegT/DnrJ/EryC1/StrS family aminotransferase [Desulforhopalus sp.]|nr:DegT/DnrJ/EryC1/StrS family aminotransferase [Desulforhopalus sp.]